MAVPAFSTTLNGHPAPTDTPIITSATAKASCTVDEPACRFTVPVCPSTNNLYRGKRFKTADYVNWRESAGWIVKAQRPVPLKGRLRVLIEAPLAKNWDLDNLKPILDLAQALGIIENDNRVDHLTIVRTAPGSEMVVSIWPM